MNPNSCAAMQNGFHASCLLLFLYVKSINIEGDVKNSQALRDYLGASHVY